MTTSRRAVAVTGVALAVALAAAGCGSGSAFPGAAAPTTVGLPGSTAPATGPALGSGRQVVSWDVAGVKRTAVVVVPAASAVPAPVVFVFHGHGGNGAAIERKFRIEQLWPEAIVVYPDGLVGHEGITDPEGVKPGWQTAAGEAGDRDVAFFDVMLATLRSQQNVDAERIFLMGHSNGSAFVSLLLNVRGDAVAATANLSAQPGRLLVTDPVRSMFMAMGERDPIVPYENQRRSIPVAERKLGVDPAHATVDGYLRSERAPGNIELETYVYPGGHEPPPAVPGLVVDFFRRHSLADG